MSSISPTAAWSTQNNRPWNKPQLQNSGTINIADNPPHFAIALTEFDMANSHNIRLKAYVDNYTSNQATVHMDSWSDSIFYSGACSLLQVNKNDLEFQTGDCSDDGQFESDVFFDRPFAAAPQVVVWLTGFDFERGKNFRIRAEPSSITATSFHVKVSTWGDTHLYWASCSWVACPTDSPTLASGTYNVTDSPPWNKPTVETTGQVSFPAGRFVGAPNVIVGINSFDVDSSGASIRIKAATSNISATGFTWNLDTWSDTTLYAMGASYIALQA